VIDDLIDYFRDKKILILGFGREGISTYKLIRKYLKEHEIYISDKQKSFWENYDFLQKDKKVKFICGEEYLEKLEDYDIVMKSPGISFSKINTANYIHKIKSQLELLLEFFNVFTIGITGTNGKTTSAFFMFQLLNRLNIRTAYIGTIGFYLPEKSRPLVNTTPDLYDLYEMLVEAADNGCEAIAMEVSSQALSNRRVDGLKFDMAAFTNLTQDHLDYHHTMEDYELAKLKLFNNIKRAGYAVINMYDEYGKDIVCSSVSSIVTTTVNGILALDKGSLSYLVSKKGMSISIKNTDEVTQILIGNMVSLLKELEKKYPANIEVK